MIEHVMILSLIIYLVVHTITELDGPYDMIKNFRKLFITYGPELDGVEDVPQYTKNVIGDMLLCFWCTGWWVGAFLALLYGIAYSMSPRDILSTYFASLGAACLLHMLADRS